ncbi:hypothetical protein [Arthrobacter sp. ISL-95]|uniref:hypothetical protein n=1 Tax=Arthrobacter sp. ISL-95 TaxID=2819116 RepID=UPI001BE931E1|nr:hypothetical protein [Arthrobacter sp. ISL-95]MBT2588346.1 hypothetical protein [Arthrobacter sp. ISL-95]
MAEVLSAASLSLALVVAGASIYFSLKEHNARTKQEAKSIEQEQAQNRLQERAQAERVACWLEYHDKYPAYRVHVLNASDQPIWGVRIKQEFGEPKEKYFAVVPPGSQEVPINYTGENPGNQAVYISFRDNNGQRWDRPTSFDGALRKAPFADFGEPTVTQEAPPSEEA